MWLLSRSVHPSSCRVSAFLLLLSAWEIFEQRVDDLRAVRQIYNVFEERLTTELKRLQQQALQQWDDKCIEVSSVSFRLFLSFSFPSFFSTGSLCISRAFFFHPTYLDALHEEE